MVYRYGILVYAYEYLDTQEICQLHIPTSLLFGSADSDYFARRELYQSHGTGLE